MMKFTNISGKSLLVGWLLFGASCSEHLKVSPTSVITNASFWKTEDDVNGALAGMYVKLREVTNLTLFQLGEGRSEVMEHARIAGTLDFDRLYLNTLSPSSPGPGWQSLYSTVNAANLIIKYVPGITFRQEAVKNAAIAQAYTMRAYAYFVMVRTWGALPLRTEPTESYSPETTQKERSPKEAVFQLIKEDLQKATELFPNNNFGSSRSMWSRASAYALKAEVYLWTAKQLNGGQADFSTALEACNEVQKADVSLLPTFSSIFSYNNKSNKEILMAMRYQNLESPHNYFREMWAGGTTYPSRADQSVKDIIGAVGSTFVWMPTQLVRDQFSMNDQRRAASFLEIYETSATGVRTYWGTIVMKGKGMEEAGVRHFKDDIILYRYADVLLMKAEAKNGLGQDPAQEINLVRQRAFGTAYAANQFVNGTQEQNDAAILKERLLELAFEGKRWWDLVRFNKTFDVVPSLKDRKGQDHLLLFPIGITILSLEPFVKQNPGYN